MKAESKLSKFCHLTFLHQVKVIFPRSYMPIISEADEIANCVLSFLGTGLLGAPSLGGHNSSSYEPIFDFLTNSESLRKFLRLANSVKYGFYDFLL